MGSIPYADTNGTGVTFRVWAPNASSVGVKGQFNGWATTPLVNEGASGNWSKDIAGARAGQEYKYVVNGNSDRRDPRNRRTTHSAGNSIVYDPNSFDWGGQSFSQPWRNDLVIYEMHPGTFNAEDWVPSTFDECAEKLDYIESLGVSAVQLMPVAEFASDKSWGYNPADPFAIESSLGGPDALKRFVKACHARGIAVLVDVVHNHYGPSDLPLWQFDGWSQNGLGGIYFYNSTDGKANTWWGQTRPDFGRTEVRDYIKDAVRMLMSEYRIDGLRWDSVFNILYYNDGASHNSSGESLLREINDELAFSYPDRYRIAEDNAFDYSINFQSKWDTDFETHLQWQVTRAGDSERNMGWLGDKIVNGASHSRVIFSECHDSCGDLNNKKRLPRDIDPDNPWSIWARKRQLLAATVVMTSPGIPMIFQGQEMNEDWTFSAETALRWGLTNTMSGMVKAYSDLIHLRRNRQGGTQGLKGTGVNAHHRDDINKVIAYIRWDAGGGSDDVVVVANFGVTTWNSGSYYIEFPSEGDWYCWFNGDSQEYGADYGGVGPARGSKVTASGSPARAAVNMGMYSSLVFSKTKPPTAGTAAFSPAHPSGCIPVEIQYQPGEGPLMGASTVVVAVGHNGWQGSTSQTMTNEAGTWKYTYPVPDGTWQLNVAFNDGKAEGATWDNNLGSDWNITVTNCANLPSLVTVSPSTPRGCVPVAITYQERSGPLTNAAQVYMYLGRNGWQGIQSIAMTSTAPHVWTYTYTLPDDTWQLDYVFNDGGSRWDNNNGADWKTYVTECADSLAPSISITNPVGDLTVTNTVASYALMGTVSGNIAGNLYWTNFGTGMGGSLAVASAWNAGNVTLADGINLIRVSGTNSAANPNAASHDAASNAPYATTMSWVNGQNGGSGWGGGWQLLTNGPSGFFWASQPDAGNLNIASNAWGLWANSDGYAAAVRPLAGVMNVDDEVGVKFENNSIDPGRSVGIAFQNRYGQSLFEFYFVGGATNYVINDLTNARPTDINWTDQGFQLFFKVTGPSTYRFLADAHAIQGELAQTSEALVSQVRVWNFSAGGGSDYNAYLTDLQVAGLPLPVQQYQDDVTITRQFGSDSDPDNDGYQNWEEDAAGTDSHSALSHPPNARFFAAGGPHTFLVEGTLLTRWYDIFFCTNLTRAAWQRSYSQVPGNDGAITLQVTNPVHNVYYRVGVLPL